MPARSLVLALHHSASAVDALRMGLPPDLAPYVTIGRKVYGDLSGAYRSAASRMVRGDMVAALADEMGIPDVSSFARVLVISWSAGYGWIDTALDHGAILDGWIALDSGYGVPSRGVLDLARRARRSEAIYAAVYTDIATEPAYPSTRAYLEAVEAGAGPAAGLFSIERRAHDHAALAAAQRQGGDAAGAFWRNEHVAAYRRGPEMLAAALRALEAPAAVDVAQTAG